MNIGFDIDGVLADINKNLAETLEDRFDVVVPNPPDKMYVINEYSGLPKEEADEYFWMLVVEENLFAKCHTFDGFIDLCNKCINDPDLEVFIVTHRFYHGKKYDPESAQIIVEFDTIDWLKNKLPNLNTDNVHFVEGSKAPIIEELGLEMYIDDRHENAEDVAPSCNISLLMNRPYNHNLKEEKSIRVYDPKDVMCIIDGLKTKGI